MYGFLLRSQESCWTTNSKCSQFQNELLCIRLILGYSDCHDVNCSFFIPYDEPDSCALNHPVHVLCLVWRQIADLCITPTDSPSLPLYLYFLSCYSFFICSFLCLNFRCMFSVGALSSNALGSQCSPSFFSQFLFIFSFFGFSFSYVFPFLFFFVFFVLFLLEVLFSLIFLFKFCWASQHHGRVFLLLLSSLMQKVTSIHCWEMKKSVGMLW